MEGGWNCIGFQLLRVLVLIFGLQIRGSWSLNDKGVALLEFRERVTSDPSRVFANWDPENLDPCLLSGFHCVDGKLHELDLNGLSLGGTLAPKLGKLTHLRSLVLQKNRFAGPIPKESGTLAKLETLDLRGNNFRGEVPRELGSILSLKRLLLRGNKLGRELPSTIRLPLLCKLRTEENIKFPDKKSRHRLKLAEDSIQSCGDNSGEELSDSARRRLVEQSSRNLEAELPPGIGSGTPVTAVPMTRSSGSFPAIASAKKNQPPPQVHSTPPHKVIDAPSDSDKINHQLTSHTPLWNKWMYFLIIPILYILGLVIAGIVVMCRKHGVPSIGPYKTGLSGPLQKAFITDTGVPKLNRSELETACEDFSNVIDTINGCTMYKGTLSSGVEIAVTSTSATCAKEWSKNAEMVYRKKIDTLSRINHKNFVNLIGYCEEDEPFCRMMIFEYAPNGTLFQHLHIKEMEYLDWTMRMRIVMGTAYCLEYMHELSPPILHSNLTSHAIYLTDDYAAKIKEVCFMPEMGSSTKISGTDGPEQYALLPHRVDLETNVYSFGILLLEIISGKFPYSEERGTLDKFAVEYLNDRRGISYMIDQTLKSFNKNELDVICEVIQECVRNDPRHRPKMKEITAKLSSVIAFSPDQAIPRLSPLWWAELEILSLEAT